ncbi:50S ribosomal protein L10 [Nitrosophilus alvini]|uniref:50S ribosomal protein L10 n=1 Tax=Nitrosophilus alvini TaxID=2714855 RepID=UPI00190C740D|nr:50S ribosomal protein L10 [Nitrosophilus alvini]
MNREQKAQVIDYLQNEFANSNTIIICDYKGLKHRELEELRDAAREKEAKVRVVKNTLASIALKGANIEGIELKDTNLAVWGDDPISVSKVVFDYAKEHKDNFKIKSAYIDGEVTGVEKVESFANLPSREELLGMLLSVWTAPVRNFAIGLDALRKKKEEEGAA